MASRMFLVTGGAGFIGSHIAEALVRRGDRVRIFDNLSTGKQGIVHTLEGVLTGLERIGVLLVGLEFARGAMIDVATELALPLWRCLA